MLARLQQAVTLGLIALALAWAAYFYRAGSPVWAVAGALLIVFGYALFLAIEFVLLWFVNRGDPTPNATAWQLVKAWWGEVRTAPQVFCWRQPFRADAEPDFLPPGAQRRGVVLVHGFVCNRALWNPLMARLRALGIPFVAVNLEPVFGSIDRYAQVIEAAVRRVESATGQAPIVVAHSMGGLATRAWLGAYQADARVHRVITIGTPHRGTYLGRFGLTHNTRQMRPSSAWQEALAAAEPPQRFQRFTCFYGHCDNIVFPASTATLPQADNKHIAGVAHVHMAHHDEVVNEVLRWVATADSTSDARREPGATPAR
ncbi:MAG TPA: alpha/beta fold hydrolase [Albitalea sp.]|uniref:esterase/lipase family protein n=1 Tax=Piscinibacter sp. TaxID=1903157 RepID=UPI002ECFC54B